MNDPKLSPADAMVVFADLQGGIVDLPLTSPRAQVIKAARGVAKLARVFDMPTLISAIPDHGGGPAQVIPDMAEVRGGPIETIQRTTPDSWANDAIRAAIQKTGRKTLILSGVATEIAIQLLALSATANGYKVYVVTDACGGLSARSEDAALRRLTAAGVVTTSVVALAGELAGDFSQAKGGEAISTVFDMVAG